MLDAFAQKPVANEIQQKMEDKHRTKPRGSRREQPRSGEFPRLTQSSIAGHDSVRSNSITFISSMFTFNWAPMPPSDSHSAAKVRQADSIITFDPEPMQDGARLHLIA
jgi:hypothetical protein